MGAVGGRPEFLARISWHVTDRKLRIRIHRTKKGQWQIFHVYFEQGWARLLTDCGANMSFFEVLLICSKRESTHLEFVNINRFLNITISTQVLLSKLPNSAKMYGNDPLRILKSSHE